MASSERRAYVVLSLAVSIDGRIAPPLGPPRRLGSDADLARLYALRAWADALVVGAQTLRAIDPPMGGAGCRARVVVLSRRGALPDSLRAFRPTGGQPRPVLVTALGAPAAHPFAAARGRARPLHWPLGDGGGSVDVGRLLLRLERLGHRRIVVEGGGQVAASFLRADGLDELVLTTAPLVLGGHGNGPFADFVSAANEAPRFVLHRLHRRGDESLVRWRKVAPPTANETRPPVVTCPRAK